MMKAKKATFTPWIPSTSVTCCKPGRRETRGCFSISQSNLINQINSSIKSHPACDSSDTSQHWLENKSHWPQKTKAMFSKKGNICFLIRTGHFIEKNRRKLLILFDPKWPPAAATRPQWNLKHQAEPFTSSPVEVTEHKQHKQRCSDVPVLTLTEHTLSEGENAFGNGGGFPKDKHTSKENI